MSFKLNRLVACLAMGTALGLSGAAWAQDLDAEDPNVTVQDRERPDYDPLGIRAGTFLVFPSLTVQGGYDDNVYATNDDEQDDFFATVRPEVEARSDWNRHQLDLGVAAESGTYLEEDDNNYLDFFSNAAGRVDITRDSALTGALQFNRLHEDRDSPDALGEGQEITTYTQPTARLSYRQNFNRLFAIVGTDFTRYDYEDSDDVNEDDRDRNQYQGRLRTGYQVSERLAGFAEGIYEVRDYDQTPNDQGFNRNSDGYIVRGGVEVDFTGILFGEAALGYSHREYDDDDLNSVGGLNGAAGLTWNVTRLTSVIFTAEADIKETTVDFEGDEASARFDKGFSVDVTHELLRNVLLNGNADYTRSDFEGTSRSDDIFGLGAGVSYLINRNLSLDATYRWSKRESDDGDAEYTRNIVLVGVTARL